jgi:PAS domain-containing protein
MRRRSGQDENVFSKLHDIVSLQRTLELLPAAAYTCDSKGCITYFNRGAARIWGRKPALNDPADRYCGSVRLFAANGAPIDRDESLVAQAIEQKREFLGQEVVIERAGGTRVPVLTYVTPILDDDGTLLAAVNILVNISQRKRIEKLLEDANAVKDLYRVTLADALRSELRPMQQALRDARSGAKDAETVLRRLERGIGHMLTLVDELVDSPDRPRPPPPVKPAPARREKAAAS